MEAYSGPRGASTSSPTRERDSKQSDTEMWKCVPHPSTSGKGSWDQSQETEELKTIGNNVPEPHHTLTHSNQKLETEPMTAGPTPELLLKGQTKAAR